MKKPMSEKMKLVRLILIMAVCLAIGAAVGYAGVQIRELLPELSGMTGAAARIGAMILTACFALMNLCVLLWSHITADRCAAQAANPDWDDENALDRLEDRIGLPMIITNVLMVINMAIFPAITMLLRDDAVTKAESIVMLVISVVVFIGALLGSMLINKKCVDTEKLLNPEKRGSVLDNSFQKTWLASCDEAQKQIIHQAGFHAYNVGTKVCSVLWLIGVLGAMLFDTGIMPEIMVCIVWLALQISYFTEAARLEHPKHN